MIFAIKPFEIHDGDGIRTTVFFKGCPLRCKWCHNPESFSMEKELLFDEELCRGCLACTNVCKAHAVCEGRHVFLRDACTHCGRCTSVCAHQALELCGTEKTAHEIAEEVLRDEVFMKGSGGGVTFSGGEPLLQPDLCTELAVLLKERGINIAVDTSLYVPTEALEKILPYTDTFLADIKAIDEDVHIACTGVSNKRILDNFRRLDKAGASVEVRYPCVPGMNDDQAERIAEFLNTLHSVKRVRVIPYHNYAERKYRCLGKTYPLPDVPVPDQAFLRSIMDWFRRCGIQNVETY